MFTGKELDAETGLYYFGARYLDPQLSRWMSVDPKGFELINPMEKNQKGELVAKRDYSVIESTNWYSYASNNPIIFVDPTGFEVTSWIGIVNMDFGRDYSNQAAEQWSEGGYGWAALSIVASASEYVYDLVACFFGADKANILINGATSYFARNPNQLGSLPLEINANANIFNNLLNAANQPYKNGLFTVGGRALTKHPNIVGANTAQDLYNMFGNQSGINQAANDAIKYILENGTSSTMAHQVFGNIIDYTLESGLGVRFSADTNTFIGFLGRGVQ